METQIFQKLESFILDFIKKSVSLVISKRTFQKSDQDKSTCNLEDELSDIFDEGYSNISPINYSNQFNSHLPDKFYIVEILLIGKNNKRVLVELWEFQCECLIDWDNIYTNTEENILMLNANKNISHILTNLPELYSEECKLGFKIYSGRNRIRLSINSTFPFNQTKTMKFYSAGKRIKLFIKVDYLEKDNINKLKEIFSKLHNNSVKIISKRKRFFSEGDIEEFRIKVYDPTVLIENHFSRVKKSNRKITNSKIDKLMTNMKDDKIRELLDKYYKLKKQLDHDNTWSINYWGYLNMYFKQVYK